MKIPIYFLLCIFFISCGFLHDKSESDDEPSYKATIIWDSGLYSNYYKSHIVEDDAVYFYERPPGYHTVNIYALTKLDAKSGTLIWRSPVLFSNIIFCQPIITGDFVYVFLEPNIIICFNKETGIQTATIKPDINNLNLNLQRNPANYQEFMYVSLWDSKNEYFARFDTTTIIHTGDPSVIQSPVMDILWLPDTKSIVMAKPVIHNNNIFTGTFGSIYSPVELAGFDIDTKEMVFHVSFGGPDDVNVPLPETGNMLNPILIYNDTIYYLSWSIRAWDLQSKKIKFCHIFYYDNPYSNWYPATNSLQPVYYNDKIFYTSGESYVPDKLKNIHCINSKTGELIWNDIAKNSDSPETNVIIAHNKLYVSQYNGLRVYNPETGKLIGVDKSFFGESNGRNILYKDYMITLFEDRANEEICKLVAVYVGK